MISIESKENIPLWRQSSCVFQGSLPLGRDSDNRTSDDSGLTSDETSSEAKRRGSGQNEKGTGMILSGMSNSCNENTPRIQRKGGERVNSRFIECSCSFFLYPNCMNFSRDRNFWFKEENPSRRTMKIVSHIIFFLIHQTSGGLQVEVKRSQKTNDPRQATPRPMKKRANRFLYREKSQTTPSTTITNNW